MTKKQPILAAAARRSMLLSGDDPRLHRNPQGVQATELRMAEPLYVDAQGRQRLRRARFSGYTAPPASTAALTLFEGDLATTPPTNQELAERVNELIIFLEDLDIPGMQRAFERLASALKDARFTEG